ncbi:hypothetical protein Tco_0809870, partial [Tanacetum coccineum]
MGWTTGGGTSSVLPLLVGCIVSFVTSGSRSTTLGEEVTHLVSEELELDRQELDKAGDVEQPEVDRFDLAESGGVFSCGCLRTYSWIFISITFVSGGWTSFGRKSTTFGNSSKSDLVELSDVGMRIFFRLVQELLVLNEVTQMLLELNFVAVNSLGTELKQTKLTMGKALVKLVKKGRNLQEEGSDEMVRNMMKDKSKVFKTPTQGKTSGEEDIIPTTLEAAKTLSKVASQRSKSVDKGKRYKRRKESKGKDIDTGFEDISTGFEDISTCFEYISTGFEDI